MNESKVVINLNENNINIGPFLNNENEEYETSYYKYSQLGPEPIGYSNNDNYYDIDSEDKTYDSPIVLKKTVNNDFTVQSSVCKNVYDNMTTVNSNKITNIHCFWCCHSFSNKPCFLPIELSNDEFTTVGCFCSPECASAYNFKYYINNSWEYNQLLNMLYKITYNNNSIVIKPAPPKECLNIFGGTMSINEFRSNCNYFKNHIISYPPLIITETKHEEYILPNDNNFRIKRNKPLKKNTLDKYLQ